MKIATLKKAGATVVAVVFWLAVWYIAALIVGKPLLLPTPLAVLKTLGEMVVTLDFWRSVGLSLLRVGVGIAAGILAASLLAALTSFLPLLRRLFSPLITVIRATPVVSFIILVLLFMGREILPLFITFLMVFPIVWTNLDAGFAAADRSLLQMAKVYRFGKMKKIRFLYLPQIKPYFLSACRTSIGLGWKAGIAAEVIALPLVSIGRHLSDAKLYIETESLFAWTLAVILLSLLIEFGFLALFGKPKKPTDNRR